MLHLTQNRHSVPDAKQRARPDGKILTKINRHPAPTRTTPALREGGFLGILILGVSLEELPLNLVKFPLQIIVRYRLQSRIMAPEHRLWFYCFCSSPIHEPHYNSSSDEMKTTLKIDS